MEASRGYATTSDTDTFHPRDDAACDRTEAADLSQPLALPAPGAGGSASGAPQLGVGQTVQMDHMGPLVIGEDGSVGRIANWDKLSEREQEVGGSGSAAQGGAVVGRRAGQCAGRSQHSASAMTLDALLPQVALRRITARNRDRLARLRGEAAAAQAGGAAAAGGGGSSSAAAGQQQGRVHGVDAR